MEEKATWINWVYPIGMTLMILVIFSMQEKPEKGFYFDKICTHWNKEDFNCQYLDESNGTCFSNCQFVNLSTEINTEELKKDCMETKLTCTQKLKIEQSITTNKGRK